MMVNGMKNQARALWITYAGQSGSRFDVPGAPVGLQTRYIIKATDPAEMSSLSEASDNETHDWDLYSATSQAQSGAP